jgi:hypothetical protein
MHEFTCDALAGEGERFVGAIRGMSNRGLALTYTCKQINHHLCI